MVLNESIEDARKLKEKRLFFKVDFARAFDTVNWDYFINMKTKMNFPAKWIQWIQECISISRTKVLVNGNPTGEFALERRLRQRDPLSPFLFLLAAEGLNLMTKRAVERGLLKATEIGRNRIQISHIQYADDTMFIVGGEIENARAIKWLLKNFELALGLSVNFDKSWAFGVNTEREEMAAIAGELRCRVEDFSINYSGLKVGGRLLGLETRGDVVEKVKGRIKGWDRNSLSMGGRITVVNSILSALPVYGLSLFPLPKKVSQQIRGIQCKFFCGVVMRR